jgi:hypothetical protein
MSIPEGCKPFDLERALAGDPVVTRNGRPVTQLVKFDVGNVISPVCGVLGDNILTWRVDGRHFSNCGSTYDLFMAPKKRTVWVNLYPDSGARLIAYAHAFEDKDEADKSSCSNRIGNRAWPVEIEE